MGGTHPRVRARGRGSEGARVYWGKRDGWTLSCTLSLSRFTINTRARISNIFENDVFTTNKRIIYRLNCGSNCENNSNVWFENLDQCMIVSVFTQKPHERICKHNYDVDGWPTWAVAWQGCDPSGRGISRGSSFIGAVECADAFPTRLLRFPLLGFLLAHIWRSTNR